MLQHTHITVYRDHSEHKKDHQREHRSKHRRKHETESLKEYMREHKREHWKVHWISLLHLCTSPELGIGTNKFQKMKDAEYFLRS